MGLLTNLVAYYKLDESSGTAPDAVGSSTLADHGSVGTAAGRIFTARSFDGATGFLSGTLAQPSTYSVAGWVYLDALPADNALVAGWTGDPTSATSQFSGVLGVTPAGHAIGYLYDGAIESATGTATLSTGAWHHLAMVVVAGAQLTLYVDGAADGSTPIGTPFGSWFAGPFLHVGGVTASGSPGFNSYLAGRVDELGVWDRALSAAEVARLYGGGGGLAYASFADATAGSRTPLGLGPLGRAAAPSAGPTPVSAADSAAGADSATLLADVPASDSGAGVEGTVALAALLGAADSGTAADSPALAAAAGDPDAGTGTDAGTVFSGLAIADGDSAAGAEGAPALLAAASSADSGAGVESATATVTLSDGDSAAGADASALVLAFSSADSGVGSDAGSVDPDVTTVEVASADSGAGVEGAVAIAAGLADDELPVGIDNAWVLAGTVAAPYRDRQLLRLLADALRDTAEFDEVLTSGLPEDHGRTASDLRLACLELDHWADADHWGDFESTEQVRTVAYTLHLLVRAEDPDLRDDELDRLVAVAANTLNGIALGDVSIPNKTRLLRGKYQPAAGPERRMAVAGQFVYTLPDFDRHTAAEDV